MPISAVIESCAALDRLPKTEGRPVAVFDCDGTLIKGDIGESMLYYQIENFLFRGSPAHLWQDFPKREELNILYEKLFAAPREAVLQDPSFTDFAQMLLSWYFGQLEQGKTEKACSDIVRLWSGFLRDEALRMAEQTLKNELTAPLGEFRLGSYTLPKGIRFIAEAVQILDEVRARGFDVWIVSGSNQWSAEAVAHKLGVPSDHVIGIDVHEVNSILGAKVRTPVPVLSGKVEALKKRGVSQPKLVVSDSTYDVPLFRYSSNLRVLVNSMNHSGDEFFLQGEIRRDDSWIVINEPTYLSP